MNRTNLQHAKDELRGWMKKTRHYAENYPILYRKMLDTEIKRLWGSNVQNPV